MHHLAGQWIPPDERGRFVTSYLGSSVGIAIFYPLFGYLLSIFPWTSVFYLSGAVGFTWFICWHFYVFDSPAQHPRIDPHERVYIEKSLHGVVCNDRRAKVPWNQILRSKAIWMLVICQWGSIWGLYTLMTQGPTYFRIIHGWNVQMVGLMSGIPHLLRMIFAYVFSTICDSLMRSKRISRGFVRKMAAATCTIVNSLFVLCLAFAGCNSTMAVIGITLATMAHGAVSSGPLASVIDLSPNYSGVILGLVGMIACWPGFISPYVVGRLTNDNVSHREVN